MSALNQCTAYIGLSYYYDLHVLHDERIVCISNDFDDVYNYLAKIRHLPIVDPDDLEDSLTGNSHGSCASITKASFSNRGQYESFLAKEEHEPFIMTYYGKIDRRIAGISKGESKDVKVPAIVMDIIEKQIKLFKDELNVAQHTLKSLLYFINGFDNTKKMVDSDCRLLVRNCDLIQRMIDGEGYELSEDMYKRHPILFCSEQEYRNMIDVELGNRALDNQYRTQMRD